MKHYITNEATDMHTKSEIGTYVYKDIEIITIQRQRKSVLRMLTVPHENI